MRTVMKTVLGGPCAEKARMEQIISTSALHWEIVRPARLTDGPRTGTYRVIVDYTAPHMRVRSIACSDIADYLVREAVSRRNLGEYPAIAG